MQDVAYLRFLPDGLSSPYTNKAGKFVSIHCLDTEQVDKVRSYDDHHFLHNLLRRILVEGWVICLMVHGNVIPSLGARWKRSQVIGVCF